MKLSHFDVWHLVLLVLVCALAVGWLVDRSRCRTRLHWAKLRADTNDETITEVCKVFEREENYTCDVFFVTTPYGNFYTGMNVIRPTDSSFWVDLPGNRYRQLSVDLRGESKDE
jgi:hypothetical protein